MIRVESTRASHAGDGPTVLPIQYSRASHVLPRTTLFDPGPHRRPPATMSDAAGNPDLAPVLLPGPHGPRVPRLDGAE